MDYNKMIECYTLKIVGIINIDYSDYGETNAIIFVLHGYNHEYDRTKLTKAVLAKLKNCKLEEYTESYLKIPDVRETINILIEWIDDDDIYDLTDAPPTNISRPSNYVREIEVLHDKLFYVFHDST